MVSSVYTPPLGEYVRPQGRYVIEPDGIGSFDRHYVRGAGFHQPALAGYLDGDRIFVELVPEPGNPHDPWAVAFHVRGKRIGYMASGFADGMHEYIAGHNRQGRAVYAEGEVSGPLDAARSATVFLPWWRHQEAFREESGVQAECDSLIGALPDEARMRAMQTSQNLSAADMKRIRSKKALAPHLVWSKRRGVQIPVALRYRLIDWDKTRKEEARQLREAGYELARQAKVQEKAAKLGAAKQLDDSIRSLALQGLPKTEIARVLSCSVTKVRSTLQRAGVRAPNANETSRNERLQRSRQALVLQRDGLTRHEIAQFMGCGFETVKNMLKDAKFFEDPSGDPQRLARARAVSAARDIVKLSDAAAKLGWTTKAVKAARSDVAILDQISSVASSSTPA